VRLAFASYLDVIGEEADRITDTAARGRGLAVPSCPGWTLDDLVGHLAEVYRHWTAQVLAAHPAGHVEVPDGDEPPMSDPISMLDREVVRLVGALQDAGSDAPCWNWSGTDLVVAWVARRMAHESAVHRVDAEMAAGLTTPIETELAVDGIDERLDVHLGTDIVDVPEVSLGGSICLVCSDADAAWVIDTNQDTLRWRSGRGPADAVLVGTASDLLLFTWNRIGVDALLMTGKAEVAAAWRTLPV
jgi:uncharacterized protein (TIGR03083 family)